MPTNVFTSPDPTHLRDHVQQCAFARGPLHGLWCTIEALDVFLAPRFVTTLAVLTVVLLAGVSLPV